MPKESIRQWKIEFGLVMSLCLSLCGNINRDDKDSLQNRTQLSLVVFKVKRIFFIIQFRLFNLVFFRKIIFPGLLSGFPYKSLYFCWLSLTLSLGRMCFNMYNISYLLEA